jgi:hypothetical protein
MKKIISVFFSVFLSLFAFAQDTAMNHAEQQPTGMRAEGKIYVVLAVVLTILAGLFVYLIRLDRKISKLEKSS